MLLVAVGEHRLAFPLAPIAEVVPLARLEALGGHAALRGLLDLRGQAVPVVDLGVLLLGRATAARAGARIVLARVGAAGSERLLGLVAERVLDVGPLGGGAGSAGGYYPHAGRLVRLCQPGALLPAELWAQIEGMP